MYCLYLLVANSEQGNDKIILTFQWVGGKSAGKRHNFIECEQVIHLFGSQP